MTDLEALKIQMESVMEIFTQSINDENKLFVEGQLYGLDVAYKLIEKLERENEEKEKRD